MYYIARAKSLNFQNEKKKEKEINVYFLRIVRGYTIQTTEAWGIVYIMERRR